jgi:hypothetical protein
MRAGTALALLLGGCQPLPHPFAEDGAPAALLAVPDNIDIAIGSFEGEPQATAAKLPAAVAQALLKHNIPASAEATNQSSYQLDGRIEERPNTAGKSTVTVFWRLRNAAGDVVNERSDQVIAPTSDWNGGNDAPIAELAAAGANGLATKLLGEAPPPKEQPGGGRTRVAIRKVSGAPGDGDTSLASSLNALLKRRDIDLVDPANGKPQLAVDADIAVAPVKDGKQHVKIVWRVSRAGGGEIGNVAQENDVPKGRLDGPWGDIAYSVAMAAEGGIMQIIDRGTPRRPLGGEATAAVTPSLPSEAGAPSMPTTPPPVDASMIGSTAPIKPSVPGNIDAPEINLPPVNVGRPSTTTPGPVLPTPVPDRDVPVLLPYRGVPIPH